MPAGASPKRERQYKHIKQSAKKSGRYGGRAEEVAARTVNKIRAEKGETKSQRRKKSSGRSSSSRTRSSSRGSASSRSRSGRSSASRSRSTSSSKSRSSRTRSSSGGGARRSSTSRRSSSTTRRTSGTRRSSSSRRGFAGMTDQRQRQIAAEGGRAAHEQGTAHEFSTSEARQAGQKGGEAVSRDRSHMAAIGRRGGER